METLGLGTSRCINKENYLDVYLGEEKIQEVSLYELDFGR